MAVGQSAIFFKQIDGYVPVLPLFIEDVIPWYIKMQTDPISNLLNEEGDATFKQLKKYGRTRVLHLLNPKYDDIELRRDTEYGVVGVVIEKKKRYR